MKLRLFPTAFLAAVLLGCVKDQVPQEMVDNDPDVKLFFKIPSRFKIDTPIGSYNPDWAVYLTRDGEEKLYFVLETKGSIDMFDLRERESMKIHCGIKHFEALESGIEMQLATNWNDVKMNI